MKRSCQIAVFVLSLFWFQNNKIEAQQLPIFTQYREMSGFINPAAIPLDHLMYNYSTFIGTSARFQWVTKENAPQTQTLHGEWIGDGDPFAIMAGGYIINDKAGRVGTTGLYGRFGSIFSGNRDEEGFSAAISLGGLQYRVNPVGLRAKDSYDEAAQPFTKIAPDVGIGVFGWKKVGGGNYVGNNILYGGISAPQIIGFNSTLGTFRTTGATGDTTTKKLSFLQKQHFYAHGGYVHRLNDESSFIDFVCWIKYVPNAPLHVDFTMRYQPFDFLWFGVGINTAYNMHIDTGLYLNASKSIRLGYGFDYNISPRILYFGNSHEVNLSFAFGGDGSFN